MHCLRSSQRLSWTRLCLSSLLGLASFSGWAQDATMTVSVSATAMAFLQDQQPTPQSLERAGSLYTHAAISGQSGGLTGDAQSTAWGKVGYGYMQLYASGGTQLSGGGPVGEVKTSATARAGLTDSFLITCPACVAGTEATVTFRVLADGGAGADVQMVQDPNDGMGSASFAYASISSSFTLNARDANDPSQAAGSALGLSVLRMEPGGGYYHDRPMWSEWVTARFTLGDPLSFNWWAVADGNAAAGNYTDVGTMNASTVYGANYSAGFYWGGITEVRTASGDLLTGITAFNAAGVNYANALAPPVPEPSATWLMLAGLAGLAVSALLRGRLHRRRGQATAPLQVSCR
jgi:PEP-CTERM motif